MVFIFTYGLNDVPRIIFVNRFFSPDHSATSQILSDLAFHLAEVSAGEQTIHVITSRQTYEQSERLAKEEVLQGVQVHRVGGFNFGRQRLWGRLLDYLSFYLMAMIQMFKLARRGDYLISKTDPPLLSIIGLVVSRIRGCRQINWVQDLFPEVAQALLPNLPWRLLAPPLRGLRNLSLRHADHNVVIGSRMQERLLAEDVHPERITVIENWSIAPLQAPPDRMENLYRSRWNLNDTFILGYSGNMGRAHLFEAMIHAAKASQEREDIQWIFIGGGPKRAEVERALAPQRGKNVQFHPYQPREKLHHSLSLPDMHLVSLEPEMEGLIFPSKFVGTLQAGRGVLFIGDPDGEMARLIREGECGLVFAPDDDAKLLQALFDLATDPERYQRYGRNALKLGQEHYSRSRLLNRWQQLLAPSEHP
uniref:GT4 n=1 Tax=Magnetococcus massalia (strain MO-1) TaxID=451514 RepID=A0A1S7LHP5_MAGMO|nr:GT4 [Candidatus Magnetococcus massalia]